MLLHRSYIIMLVLIGLAFSGCTLLSLNEDRPLLPEEIQSIKEEADSLRLQGRRLREKSDFARALDLQTQALDLSLQTGDTLLIVQDYNQLATTFRRLGRYEQAINYHYQALVYAEVCSDTTETAKKNLVVSLNGLGNAHLSMGNDRMAEDCFHRALKGETEIGSHLGMAINYANLGSIYERKNSLDSARWYYEHSMAENQLIDSKMGQSLCLVYFGRLYERQDSLLAAEAEYRKAVELMNGNEDRWHAIEPLLALGRNLLAQGRIQEASRFADESYSLASEMHSFQHLHDATELQANIYEATGNAKEALAAYKQCRNWEDSTNNRDENHVIRDICIRYEQRQTEREMTKLQEAYESNDYMHQIIFWVELGLLILALIILGLLWYASNSRKSRLDALNKLDSMRTTFFRNITHEFRTPLTIILGLSDQLKDDSIELRQRMHFIASIQQQGRTLLDLVNQLLSYSKLVAGYGQCKWCHGDIVAYIRMQMASYTDFARMRNIELKFVSNQDQIVMDFVPEYYDKIISNLLGNAFKYTSSGGSITIKSSLNEDHVKINVIDTGTGISSEDKEHIFEQFYQGQDSRMQGSTGIGLPFVQQMIHHMGGIVSAKDNLPHGTDIQIILSTHCNDETAQIQPWTINDTLDNKGTSTTTPVVLTQAPEKAEAEHEDSSMPLLLIVEDNPDVAEYIGVVLQTHYRIIKACDGYDALNKASKSLPDLIVTDLMMPGMDGYQFCHSIRQSQVLSDVPVVIVSARSEDNDRVRGYEDGADGYLLKPFNPSELIALLQRLLTQRHQTREYMRQLIAGQLPALPHSAEDAENEEISAREFLQRIHDVVDTQMVAGDLQLETISSHLNMSRSTLARRIKQIIGCAPSAYILQLRLDRARQLLQNPNLTIGEVSLQCGFDDLSYFSRVFRQNFEQTPTQYRAALDKNEIDTSTN